MEETGQIPTSVKIIAYFFIAAALAGFITGILEFIDGLQSGMVMAGLPLGIGLSGSALGHGLLTKKHRSWKWARRLAMVAIIGFILILAVFVSFPENAEVTVPWSTQPVREAGIDVWLFFVGMLGFWIWQYRVLSSTKVRALYKKPEEA